MAARTHQLSIVEAIETLSNIADLEFDRGIGIVQKHDLILHRESIHYKTIYWLHQKEAAATIHLVREIFRIILHYMLQFYKGEYGSVADQKTIEGIKAIMLLVGEAAKKLDHYGALLHPHKESKSSVTEFKEYKKLQEYYSSKIAKKKDEGGLSQWILSLSWNKDRKVKEIPFKNFSVGPFPATLKDTKRLFVDLETVKKDREYELFFIRKQDGSRFFSPRLLRNIKLVYDFENYFGVHRRIDPLELVDQWYDRVVHSCARHIIKGLGTQLDHFLKELRKVKNHELVDALNAAIMALMFSAQGRNLLHHQPIKSCSEYFEDFLQFLRTALKTKLYQKWVAAPPPKSSHLAHDLLDFVHAVCKLVHVNVFGWEEMLPVMESLLKDGRQILFKEQIEPAEKPARIWSRLANDYLALTKLLKHHPNGPLLKVIQVLESGSLNAFDPLHQQNIPQQLFDLLMDDQRISLIRMAAPVYQQVIQKTLIGEEFQGFLRSYGTFSPPKRHLIINLQNRTSWLEYARCMALEQLQDQADFADELSVVTLAVNTDFYSQLAPYHQMNQADSFQEQFLDHLQGDHSGFYFPSSISKKALKSFIEEAFASIHRIFFAGSIELTRESRLNFIEIFYLLLQLKLLEWIKPQSFSLMCKDGIDVGAVHVGLLFAFLKLVSNQEWVESDWELLNLTLHAPALLLRERALLPEPYHRMVSALKWIEQVREEVGAEKFVGLIQEGFGEFYETSILQPQLLINL